MNSIASFEKYWDENGFENSWHKELKEDCKKSWQKGFEKAKQEGPRSMIISQLKIKFNNIPEEYILKIKEADPETLVVWAGQLIYAKSLEEVFE